MTQADLAGSEITRNMLSQIENDVAQPSMNTIRYIAARLNVSPGFLLAEGNDEQIYLKYHEITDIKKAFMNEDYRICRDMCLRSESGNDALANCATANGGAVPRPGIFIANADFTNITASVAPDSPDCGLVLTSMLRIAFAQAILRRDGISIHASAVAADGKAWLFLGKSGTGKSTHARLWLRNIPGSRLLNDDNPAVRLVDGKAVAFGTPWSGKTQCYRNESSPIGGIVRLVQGDADIFTKKDEVAALVALLPSCSVVHSDAALQSLLCDTLARLIELVPVGELKCLPDNESAIICYNNLKSLIK